MTHTHTSLFVVVSVVSCVKCDYYNNVNVAKDEKNGGIWWILLEWEERKGIWGMSVLGLAVGGWYYYYWHYGVVVVVVVVVTAAATMAGRFGRRRRRRRCH